MSGRKSVIISTLFIVIFLIGLAPASSEPAAQADTTIVPWLATDYRYLQIARNATPPAGFSLPEFDDSGWAVGDAAFGTLLGPEATCTLNTTVETTWDVNSELIVRKTFDLPAGTTNLQVELALDNDLRGIWINGQQIAGFTIHDGCPARGDLGAFAAPDAALVAGTNTLVVHVLDRGVSSYLDVHVTADLEGAPPLTITTPSPLPSATADETYTVILNATGGTGAYTWSISAGALPAGLTLDPATGIISGTPTASGTFTFTVLVTDEDGTTAQKEFTLEVVEAPSFVIITGTLPDGTVGVPYSALLQAEGGSSDYTWSTIAGALPPGLTLNPDTGAIEGTPTAAGTYDFTVQVTDDVTGQTTTKAFTITIADLPPEAPTLISLDPNTAVAGSGEFVLTVTGTNFVNTSVIYWNGMPLATTYISATQLSATVPASAIATAGSASVTVVNPVGGTSNALTFTILEPAPVNQPPVANDDTASLDEDTSTVIDVAANDTDPDGNLDPSTVSIVVPPANGTLTNHGNGTVTYTPNPNFSGTDSFTYQICDTDGACDQAVVSITVRPVNDAPVMGVSQATVTVNEGATATNTGTVSDPDGDSVTLSASVGTVTANGAGNWSWSFTTTDGPAQSQLVTITADDGKGGKTKVTFNLVVNNVAPSANAGSDQTVYRNDPVNLSGTWTDPAGSGDNPYSWSWDLNGDGTPDSSGAASYGTPAQATTSFAMEGMYTLHFSVTDKDGASSSDTVTITVLNRPPECSTAGPSPANLWPPNHQMVAVSIVGVTDPEGDPITITISSIFQDEPTNGLGDGDMSPDGQGIGTPTAHLRAERAGVDNARFYHVSFTASDGHGGSCDGTIRVPVAHDQRRNAELIDEGPLYDSTAP